MKKKGLISALVLLFFVSTLFSVSLDFSAKTTEELENIYESVLLEMLTRSVSQAQVNKSSSSPILFRNIPWGTTYKTFSEILRGDGINGGSMYDSYASYSFEFNISDYGGIAGTYRFDDSGYRFSNSSVKDLFVGGFQVSGIGAYFIYGYDDNGVYTEKDDSILYKAYYEFKTVDGSAAYSVLTAKLSSLYGKGESNSASSGIWSTAGNYTAYTECTVWYGPDDTGVVLCREYSILDSTGSIDSDKVTLTYGKSNSVKLFNELKAAIAREELKKATRNNDLSGL